MAGRLTATQVKALGEGRHADGGNLFLHVKPGGKRYWKFITNAGGRRREKGLGAFPKVPLSEARQKAVRIRALLDEGEDPWAETAALRVPTFGEASAEFIGSMESGWKNDKHRAQWRSTLSTYCKPMQGKSVAEIGTNDVLACLTPIWHTKPETASRLRGRVERVLDFARARGWREGINPAIWRGHLSAILPAAGKLKRGHHGAMPYADVPAFMTALAQRHGTAARALAFTVLTAARSGEVRGATWAEIDLDHATWTIPASRMKAGREHRVPLSPAALTVVLAMPRGESGALVFPGTKPGRPMSDMTLAAVLKRMKLDGLTVHGFRSSFSTWVTECTDATIEVREAALAHAAGDRVAAAYNRSDHFIRRCALMEEWSSFLWRDVAPWSVLCLNWTPAEGRAGRNLWRPRREKKLDSTFPVRKGRANLGRRCWSVRY
ncbi:tyrosine-type recombinase/integrase [Acuticoccus sp. MNP-M23]|uniref:tyrosine-type recombinase/integrase n=1 Tax=Acuticoccus sp. MNP-M23 TaxID=3072793 RepID=UPI00281553EC|nr:integrase arm-type DNA-binding domain-containing protein [Acuticoccus sp. MNP-M23]WMS44498.1 tyrosine-type recombinase/integrase [Acuticoccus sp. MNP-M23]